MYCTYTHTISYIVYMLLKATTKLGRKAKLGHLESHIKNIPNPQLQENTGTLTPVSSKISVNNYSKIYSRLKHLVRAQKIV